MNQPLNLSTYQVINALNSDLYFGPIKTCPHNGLIITLKDNCITKVQYSYLNRIKALFNRGGLANLDLNQRKFRDYLVMNWQELEPSISTYEAIRNTSEIFHHYFYNNPHDKNGVKLFYRTLYIKNLMDSGFSCNQSKKMCLEVKKDSIRSLCNTNWFLSSQDYSLERKKKIFEIVHKLKDTKDVKLEHQIINTLLEPRFWDTIFFNKPAIAEIDFIIDFLEKILSDPSFDKVKEKFVSDPQSLLKIWLQLKEKKIAENQIIEIVTTFPPYAISFKNMSQQNLNLIRKILSDPSFDKVKEKLVSDPQSLLERWRQLEEKNFTENQIIEIVTTFPPYAISFENMSQQNLNLISKILSDPSFDKVKEKFISNPESLLKMWRQLEEKNFTENQIIEIVTTFPPYAISFENMSQQNLNLIGTISSNPNFASVKKSLINNSPYCFTSFFAKWHSIEETGISSDEIAKAFSTFSPYLTLEKFLDLTSERLRYSPSSDEKALFIQNEWQEIMNENFINDILPLLTAQPSDNNLGVFLCILRQFDSIERQKIALGFEELFGSQMEILKERNAFEWTKIMRFIVPISPVLPFMKPFLSKPEDEMIEDLQVFFNILNTFSNLHDKFLKKEGEVVANKKLEILGSLLDSLKRYRKIPEDRLEGPCVIEYCFPSNQFREELNSRILLKKSVAELETFANELGTRLREEWSKHCNIPVDQYYPPQKSIKSARK